MGTAVGSTIFLKFGWRAGAGFSLGLTGFQLLVLLARGPHCDRYTWFGWQGGMEMRKSKPKQSEQETVAETRVDTEKVERSVEVAERGSLEKGDDGNGQSLELGKEKMDNRIENVV